MNIENNEDNPKKNSIKCKLLKSQMSDKENMTYFEGVVKHNIKRFNNVNKEKTNTNNLPNELSIEETSQIRSVLEMCELPYLNVLWGLVKSEPHVVSLLPRFECKTKNFKIQIDLVSYGGKKWIKIKNKDPHDIQCGVLRSQTGNVMVICKKLVETANDNKMNEYIPKVFFILQKG
eukprot:UN31147